MANFANFEVDGVSYSYDMEARNPLSEQVKEKAFSGELVYDINSKSPVEIVGVLANKLKFKSKRLCLMYGSGYSFYVNINYTGDLTKDVAERITATVTERIPSAEFEVKVDEYNNGVEFDSGNSSFKLISYNLISATTSVDAFKLTYKEA